MKGPRSQLELRKENGKLERVLGGSSRQNYVEKEKSVQLFKNMNNYIYGLLLGN